MERNEPAYYDNLNTDLLEAIPANCQLVLEVGCGAGRLGLEYKKKTPGCAYYGVEIDSPSAAIAGTRLDMALCGSIEQIDLSFLNGKADCIVYGDVLEHLIDPWAVLRAHRRLLKPGGKMVACIPNSQHWSMLMSLLGGNWTYQENGLLDRTHLRFFTLRTISDLFAQAGMSLDSVVGRNIEQEFAATFFAALCPVLPGLGIDPGAFREQANVFQYVVTASMKTA